MFPGAGERGECYGCNHGGFVCRSDAGRDSRGIAFVKGVSRRFDVHAKSDRLVYIDDYAHHPREIEASLSSIREMWPDKRLTVAFQPHCTHGQMIFTRSLRRV